MTAPRGHIVRALRPAAGWGRLAAAVVLRALRDADKDADAATWLDTHAATWTDAAGADGAVLVREWRERWRVGLRLTPQDGQGGAQ